jgi:CRP/FNR family transcriptional regulator, cyclic AMP receptor protein
VEFQVFENVAPEHVRELLSIARRRTFERNEVVLHHGDPADSLHLIVKGHFAVRLLTTRGESALLAIRGAGEAFGELALLETGARRSATVSALDDAETFSVVQGDFFRLAKEHPGVKDCLLAILAEQIRRSNERAVVAHYCDAEERVRWALLQLGETYGASDLAAIPLTQEQLAEYAGTARATLNRVLREEVKEGTIELDRGRVRIVQPELLEKRVRRLPRLP